MNSRDEDQAWRDIVDNYGETPQIEDLTPATPASEPPLSEPAESAYDPLPWEDEGRFVPPPPPPVPVAEPRRMAAWIGLFGAPLVLLLALVLQWDMPTWLSTGITVAFVGGFLYLVATMPHGPRDPGDDGARL